MNATIELNEVETKKPVDRYVVGFLFDASMRRVALIRKQKPKWQAGLLNGIGGKIEGDELPITAMVREFFEEADYPQYWRLKWKQFANMDGTNNDHSQFQIHFFWAIGDPTRAASKESEEVGVYDCERIASGREATIGNLPWLVAAAQDFGLGKYPPRLLWIEY